MVVDAFTDLVFTPDNNRRHTALLGLTSEENDSTQPTVSNLLPPSPRDIGPLSFPDSPRYFLSSPNATLEQPITSPLIRSAPSASFPLQSLLPPLTPLADLSTPQGWGMISPSGALTPSLFVETPKSLSQDQENDKLPLAVPSTPKETDSAQKEADQMNVPSAEQRRFPQMRKPQDKNGTEGKGPRFSFSRDDNVLRLRENPPDVRRRLFDEGNDKMAPSKTNSEQQFHQTVDPNPVKPQQKVRKGLGLKSRIAPPLPIAIPTNPLSRYSIQEMPKGQTIAAITDSHLSQVTPVVPHASSSLIRVRDKVQVERPSHIPQKVEDTIHIPNLLHPWKAPAQTDAEENRIVMTSEASSVLAELKRQRAQIEASRKIASSVSIPRALKVSGPSERTCCNCKASQCIKRYCPCFATSNFCGPECGCRNCENTLNNSSCVGIARKALMERDPNAFVPRIRCSQRQKARGRQTIRGCNCRKGCEKNYCICKENGLVCGMRCTCSGPNGCQNQDQSKLSDVQQVIENMPPSKYFAPGADYPKRQDLHAAAQSTKVKTQARNSIRMKAENLVPYACEAHVADLPTNSANPILAGYPALPTPTTPSMPYNPFVGQHRNDKKRSMIFGELSDGFKRIKVADPNGMSLPELKQSSSKYEHQKCSNSGLQTANEASRLPRMPMASRLVSSDTPPVDGRELLIRDSVATNYVNGSDHLMTNEKILRPVPRILRYKFGSGKGAGPFQFPR